ncbi:MAG TPA: hypothetical protein VFO18_17475 [Methylomirabilota bacterium]|nr:hypothetical protein [Methylomirabilota bacterium]
MGIIPESVVRRWLEVLLPLVSLGLLLYIFHPEYLPHVLIEDPGGSPLRIVVLAIVFGVLGVLGLSAVTVTFFLLYAPIYLLNRFTMLIGEGGWVDRREVRFYLLCLLLLLVLAFLIWWTPIYALVLFVLMAGCGPIMWRVLV